LAWQIHCRACDRSAGACIGLGPGHPGRLVERRGQELPSGVSRSRRPRLPQRRPWLPPAEDSPVALGPFTLCPSASVASLEERRPHDGKQGESNALILPDYWEPPGAGPRGHATTARSASADVLSFEPVSVWQAFEHLSLPAQSSPSPAPSSGPGPVALACGLPRLARACGPPRGPVRRGWRPVARSASGTPWRALRLGVWGFVQ